MYRILHEQQKETAECMAYPSMTSSVILAGVHVEAWKDEQWRKVSTHLRWKNQTYLAS